MVTVERSDGQLDAFWRCGYCGACNNGGIDQEIGVRKIGHWRPPSLIVLLEYKVMLMEGCI